MIKKITLSVFTLLFSSIISAQISYTDIIPDTNLASVGPDWDPVGIDFDDDGTFEMETFDGLYFTLSLQDTPWTEYCKIWSVGDENDGWDKVQPITENSQIDVDGNYQSLGDASMADWFGDTTFPLNQDAYIAVQIYLNGNTHYGWVRVQWNGTEFIYKDYAYNTTPNEKINAGQQSLAITDYKNDLDVSYYPNPTKDIVQIISKKNIEEVHIIDLLGKTTELSISNNKVNISNLPKGIYFLHVRSNNKSAIKKIIKK